MTDHPDYLMHKTDRTEVNEEKILGFDDHSEFSYLAVEIFKEISILIVTVSSIRRSSGGVEIPYNREEAAVFGNLVRYCKISSAYLEQYTKKRMETCMILLRSLMETYINLKYFLKYKDQHTISHYIKHSLKQEKLLLELIRQREGKDPSLQHIEMRMKDSINRSIKDSGFTEEEISNSSKWADKVKQRLSEIIDPSLYIIYGNSSHSVHGNWQDLLFFHLTKSGDGFQPKSEWTTPNIQLLAPMTLMSCDLLRNFAEEVIPESKNKDALIEEIKDIFVRAYKLDKLHEQFIQKNWKK